MASRQSRGHAAKCEKERWVCAFPKQISVEISLSNGLKDWPLVLCTVEDCRSLDRFKLPAKLKLHKFFIQLAAGKFGY